MMATANVKASIEAANKNWMNAFKKTLMHLPWLAFTRQGLNCFRLTATLLKVPMPSVVSGNP
jgi:hypothetical protein